MDYQAMVDLAFKATKNSYAPYSNFKVGACLLAKSGKTYLGCNIENANYSGGICAERVALVKAVSEGEREFLAIALACVGGNGVCYPCGECRQVLSEFAPNLDVIISKDKQIFDIKKLSELLPCSFSKDDM